MSKTPIALLMALKHQLRSPKTRLTVWYMVVVAAVVLVYIAGTSFVLYWQLLHQLSRFAVQDIETIEGLLYFTPAGRLELNENYHNHPESRQLLERLLEVRAPDGTVLFRNSRLGSGNLGSALLPNEGVNAYSERSVRLSNGMQVLIVSRRHVLAGRTIVIRLGYDEQPIWSRIDESLAASFIALPVILALAGLAGFHLARQSLARLEESFERLQRFTSDASHELRTPLAAIRTVGEVGLQKSKSAADYQDTIGSMLEEVNRLTRLVENLLSISRAEAGQLQLGLSVLSPLAVAREVAALLDVLVEEKSLQLIVTGDEEVRVSADRLLLRQAITNVLHNAVKYTPRGGRIDVRVTSSNGRSVIRIADSGPGIPPAHRDKVFDRFYRVDSARGRDTGGAGLGLSIAKWAIEVQGGEIKVEDSIEGAAFSIQLPVAKSPISVTDLL